MAAQEMTEREIRARVNKYKRLTGGMTHKTPAWVLIIDELREKPRNIGELADRIAKTKNTLNVALQMLINEGFVEQKARRTAYHLTPSGYSWFKRGWEDKDTTHL